MAGRQKKARSEAQEMELGTLALENGAFETAAAAFCLAIAQEPENAVAYGGLGLALLNQEKWSEAEACFRKTVDLEPKRAEGYNNLALVFIETRRFAEAEACLEVALSLAPECAAIHNNLGLASEELGKLEEAKKYYRAAIRRDAMYAQAYYNLGNLLKKALQLPEAEECLEQAVYLQPEYGEAHHSLATLKLLQGRFAEGWRQYDKWRMKQPTRRAQGIPRWSGETLQGRSILLYYEQGFGDTIQFVRYAPLVAALGAAVVVWLPSELGGVFDALDEKISIHIGAVRPEQAFDFACPLPSLPALLHEGEPTLLATPIPYAAASSALRCAWRARIDARRLPGRLKIGIVWAGNPGHHNDANRSIPFEQFRALLREKDVEWHSLQVGRSSDDLQDESAQDVLDWSAQLTDFSQTAAALDQLDLLIAVDSSVAHLAGAMGKPVWLLVPFLPDWRWQLKREDSYWYPSMRLFRQEKNGDWAGVLQRVAQALKKVEIL
ncbi:tetratricopeptide repeat protein [Azotosporobacter soli]|uniref:tetratricopeptide repeat protein n=1 Tax=Azotosporobacter soli TaxID=3055040 RepID=UPI0031FE9E55